MRTVGERGFLDAGAAGASGASGTIGTIGAIGALLPGFRCAVASLFSAVRR